MKRIAGLLTVTAAIACALASSASAYVDPSYFLPQAVTGDGQFGANTFHLDGAFTSGGFSAGSLTFTGTDANGTHSYFAFVSCISVDPFGRNATILAVMYQKTNEPAGLNGVRIHVTDPESADSENGAGDRMDVTQLFGPQWNKAYNAGCAATQTAKTPISSGNISVIQTVAP
jgi:hypothetical protein